MEYKFGVCFCDLDFTRKIKDLVTFDTYEEAFNYYITKMNVCFKHNPRWLCPDIWIVWIRNSDNKIEQFEQLSWNTKCRLVDINE